MLTQNKVTLVPYTLTRCHEVYKQYVPDPMMTYDLFTYEQEKVDRYYQVKVLDKSRQFFAIQFEDKIVGEIQLKYLDEIKGHGTLSILITTDAYKNRGIGSTAIKLMLNYASESLNLTKVYADAIHRNSRSQYVLERLGFEYIKEDDVLKYYCYLINR